MRLVVIVIGAASIFGIGCSSSAPSSNHEAPPTTARGASAAGLCSLPTQPQLRILLGSSTTQNTPLSKAVKTDTARAIVCTLSARSQRLVLQVFSYTSDGPVAAIRAAIVRGEIGACSHNLSSIASESAYECTSSPKATPDNSGSPEMAVHVLRPRVAVRVLWTGVRGANLPVDVRQRFTTLRSVGESVLALDGTP